MIDLEIGRLNYTREGSVDYYSLDGKTVGRKSELFNDILDGNHGIWAVPTGMENARFYALYLMNKYITAFEELHREE